jgi:outer membrane protein TolC
MTPRLRPSPSPCFVRLVFLLIACSWSTGCREIMRQTDRDVASLIEKRQRESLDYSQPAPLGDAHDPLPRADHAAYRHDPSPRSTEIPEGFEAAEDRPPQEPVDVTREVATTMAASAPASQPTRFRAKVFTLTDALGYAQQHRRAYQTAKEDLYLSALALTLEHHLWTPQFAASLQGVYGNYGEVSDFDQATRFVADLSVAQRLPYGGEFTAAMVSTLIRDVGRSITAAEGSQIELGLDIPLLRDAGHVAQEDLIQLERALTYAVRAFERFRREQLVDVAQRYFDLLRSKQSVKDAITSLRIAEQDLARAIGFQEIGRGTQLETGRQEIQMLAARDRLARGREAFRLATDQFKIFIGMPLDEPIGLDDLETIEVVEQQIAAGRYPLLRPTPAVNDEQCALDVATELRLDLLTTRDRIDDAKRGVAIARNALLPNLDWSSSLTYETDPEHHRLGGFEQARATWRTEVLLSMTDRFRERNSYRTSLIDVRQAHRSYVDQSERVRAEVLSAVNQIRLQDETLETQRRTVEVVDDQRQFARRQYERGQIDNRDLVIAEDEYYSALNNLNQAKTARWTALLNFRLATGTLRVDEHGVQQEDAELAAPLPRQGAADTQ